jgi:hypothetical protein
MQAQRAANKSSLTFAILFLVDTYQMLGDCM